MLCIASLDFLVHVLYFAWQSLLKGRSLPGQVVLRLLTHYRTMLGQKPLSLILLHHLHRCYHQSYFVSPLLPFSAEQGLSTNLLKWHKTKNLQNHGWEMGNGHLMSQILNEELEMFLSSWGSLISQPGPFSIVFQKYHTTRPSTRAIHNIQFTNQICQPCKK